jgi:hypothetical protein
MRHDVLNGDPFDKAILLHQSSLTRDHPLIFQTGQDSHLLFVDAQSAAEPLQLLRHRLSPEAISAGQTQPVAFGMPVPVGNGLVQVDAIGKEHYRVFVVARNGMLEPLSFWWEQRCEDPVPRTGHWWTDLYAQLRHAGYASASQFDQYSDFLRIAQQALPHELKLASFKEADPWNIPPHELLRWMEGPVAALEEMKLHFIGPFENEWRLLIAESVYESPESVAASFIARRRAAAVAGYPILYARESGEIFPGERYAAAIGATFEEWLKPVEDYLVRFLKDDTSPPDRSAIMFGLFNQILHHNQTEPYLLMTSGRLGSRTCV